MLPDCKSGIAVPAHPKQSFSSPAAAMANANGRGEASLGRLRHAARVSRIESILFHNKQIPALPAGGLSACYPTGQHKNASELNVSWFMDLQWDLGES